MSVRSTLSRLSLLLGVVPPAIASDFSSPSAALRSLEAAYAAKSIDGAVAARDFLAEARELLADISKGDPNVLADDIVRDTATVLEKGYRLELKTKGFPDMSRVKCEISEGAPLRADLVPILEKCAWPDGSRSSQTLYAIKGDSGWKIINLRRDRA